MIQGGGFTKDMQRKNTLAPIVNESGNGLKNESGTIAMAKENRPHTANSQFFFNMADNTSLDPGRHWGYTVFGSINQGQEIVDAMAAVKTDYHEALGWQNVPIKPVLVHKVTLLPATSP